MPTTETEYVDDLLTIFGASHLGEGNLVSGANLLAAMACTLASVQRPGSGLVAADGTTLPVGTSLIISGAHTSSLVTEKVMSGLAKRQGNLVSHIGTKERVMKERAKKPQLQIAPGNPVFNRSQPESEIEEIYGMQAMYMQDTEAQWGRLVQSRASSHFDELREYHKVFITGYTKANLTAQLNYSHQGRPLVHIGVEGAADFGRYQELGSATIDGRFAAGSSSEAVRGSIFLTDPTAALGTSVQGQKPSEKWVSRMVWLVDGSFGHQVDELQDDNRPVVLDAVMQRYEAAMNSAWGKRLDSGTTEPTMVRCGFAEPQALWIEFLSQMEPRLPGIVGSARSLLGTLIFGFLEMLRVRERPAGFKLPSINHYEALARFLVNRMASARHAMLHAADNERMTLLTSNLLHKLREGPHTIRQLTRRGHKLSAAKCLEAMLILEDSGKAIQRGGVWHHAESGIQTAIASRDMVLEVR